MLWWWMPTAVRKSLRWPILPCAELAPRSDYVIQTALNQVEGDQREHLYARVRSHLVSIKREPRPKIEPKHIVASKFSTL